jgi:ABC-2 type transport system ATP-binding protein
MQQHTTLTNVVETSALGKRYRSFWALRNCTVSIPQGSISALVGPNGAGKTTLLKLLVNLGAPSAGSYQVLGSAHGQTANYLAEVGYLAQEVPLYRQLSGEDHIRMGAHLNARWDAAFARNRLSELHIPLDRPVGKLSGGQRAQVALALALAKRPRLLLLDEPVATLDPLAREEFLSALAQAASVTEGLTIVMSSHLLGDLERIANHLIILSYGETQLCGSVRDVLKAHKLLVGPWQETALSDAYTILQETHTPRQSTLLVRLHDSAPLDAQWQQHDATIEAVVLAYMERGKRQLELATVEGSRR